MPHSGSNSSGGSASQLWRARLVLVRWLLLLFVLVPLTELYLLLLVGSLIGLWPTVLLTLSTGVLGGVLARHEGLKVWRQWQRCVRELTVPEAGVLDGALVLLGGALLITPGVLTDGVGLLLLLPWSRRQIATRVRVELERRVLVHGAHIAPVQFDQAWPSEHARSAVVETKGETVED
jgi:UPF0716 protein FxsA